MGDKVFRLSNGNIGSYRRRDIRHYSRLSIVDPRVNIDFGTFLRAVLPLVGPSAIVCEAMCVDAKSPIVLGGDIGTVGCFIHVHEEGVAVLAAALG